jgi:hypothetical protein
MPLIYKPIDSGIPRLQGKRIAFCTDMGIATEERELDTAAEAWQAPSYCHPYSQEYVPLKRDELRRVPWNCPSTVYRSYDGYICLMFQYRVVSIHTHGVDPVNLIRMTSFTDKNTESLQARLRRRLVYDQRVKRCTAAAMVLHRRLGDSSAMHVLGGEIMGLVASYI